MLLLVLKEMKRKCQINVALCVTGDTVRPFQERCAIACTHAYICTKQFRTKCDKLHLQIKLFTTHFYYIIVYV